MEVGGCMILDKVNYPNDLKKLNIKEKEQLAKEIRDKILEVVSQNGGHLASNLGTVELTIALYSCLDLPKDKVIWDVGHQTYTHKILTGRKKEFNTLRKMNGIAGFPRSKESIYDAFDTGHSSTSISVALGMARARDIQKKKEKIVAVIGDGALTSGLSLEALHDAGISNTNLMVILNDNLMSISKNEGGLSRFLSKLRTRKFYVKSNNKIRNIILKIPILGKYLYKLVRWLKKRIKGLLIQNMYFENIGFTYLGPVDGHSISDMEDLFNSANNISGPVLIHVVTKKGKGYQKAMIEPNKYHAISSFNLETGEPLKEKTLDYSSVMGKALVNLAKKEKRIVTITAAMEEGTGLLEFAKLYPDRFFNVEICEEHAVTMAAGMAKEGLIPVIAIYSSFLQRGYDELVHDICLSRQHVIICVDRAGNTGNDGETHHGIYDLSYLNTIPNLTVMAPKNFWELEKMLSFAITYDGPVAIRYPKGDDNHFPLQGKMISLGKGEILRNGKDVTIVAIGKMVERAYNVAKKLQNDDIEAEVINIRFLKPLDINLINKSVKKTKKIVTIEDNDYEYGLGATVKKYFPNNIIFSIGYPNIYLEHGNISQIEEKYHLDEKSIYNEIKNFVNKKEKQR